MIDINTIKINMYVALILLICVTLMVSLVMMLRTSSMPQPAVEHSLVLTLKHRDKDYRRLQNQAYQQGLPVEPFYGVYGKELRLEEIPRSEVAEPMRSHVQALSQRGHLGASESHLSIFREVADQHWGPTVVFEDDVYLDRHFHVKLHNLLQALQGKPWDVLLLGWMCSYDDWELCRCNESLPVDEHGLIWNLQYSIGLFGYVINGHLSAQRVYDVAFPMQWMVDLDLMRLQREKQIQVVATFPPIVYHPGKNRIDSHGWSIYRPMRHYRSDTNQ
jgi:GR25 family glycosyltransferase involved in LPS biosynthesis